MLEVLPFQEKSTDSLTPSLTVKEIEQFKQLGYVVKSRLVDDYDALGKIVDYVWEAIPNRSLRKDQPEQWASLALDNWDLDEQKRIGVLRHGAWKMRSLHQYGTESFVLDATANHPQMQAVVHRLLGSEIMKCTRVRGVYVIFPQAEHLNARLGPHVDHSAAQLSAMVYIAEVPADSGGFTIWPGSHLRLHKYWQTCQGAHFNPELKDEFKEEFQLILSDTHPTEFFGNKGDVVFWHPRLIHSAGVNRSASNDLPRIRYAVPCDFQKAGRTFFYDDDLGPGVTHQWWVDTRHFREDKEPTETNLWEDWEI